MAGEVTGYFSHFQQAGTDLHKVADQIRGTQPRQVQDPNVGGDALHTGGSVGFPEADALLRAARGAKERLATAIDLYADKVDMMGGAASKIGDMYQNTADQTKIQADQIQQAVANATTAPTRTAATATPTQAEAPLTAGPR